MDGWGWKGEKPSACQVRLSGQNTHYRPWVWDGVSETILRYNPDTRIEPLERPQTNHQNQSRTVRVWDKMAYWCADSGDHIWHTSRLNGAGNLHRATKLSQGAVYHNLQAHLRLTEGSKYDTDKNRIYRDSTQSLPAARLWRLATKTHTQAPKNYNSTLKVLVAALRAKLRRVIKQRKYSTVGVNQHRYSS